MRAAGPDSKLRQTLYGAPDSAEIGGDAGMFTTSFQPWAALRGIAPHETGVIRTRHTGGATQGPTAPPAQQERSEEHTSELQSPDHLVCRLLLEKKNKRFIAQLVIKSVLFDPHS